MTQIVSLVAALAWVLHACSAGWVQHGRRCSYGMSGLVPKQGDCSTYLKCTGYPPRWKDSKCPAGGVFNPKTQSCTWPEFYPACSVPTTNTFRLAPVQEECVLPCPKDERQFMFPKLGTCTHFYLCKNRKLYIGSCLDVSPQGTYRYFNYFNFSCDRTLESNNMCQRTMNSRK